ncbi:MAG: hypothetical protein ACK521_03300 [bacterium]
MDIVKIKVGDLQIDEVVSEFRNQVAAIKSELERIENRGKSLLDSCKEYEAMASDDEERERVVSTES